jgi:hypothetical protein
MSEESKTQITAALRRLAESRGATLEALKSSRELATLESVVADASGGGATKPSADSIASSVRRLLQEAADSLDPDPHGEQIPNEARAASALLGLRPEHAGKSYFATKNRTGRQATVAQSLGIPRAAVDKPGRTGISPKEQLIGAVADYIILHENDYQTNEQRLAQRARRAPLESAMRLEWVSRFEQYARLSACVSGFRYDIELALERLRANDVAEIDFHLRKSLYYFAAYLTELEKFYEEHGLLWILPNAKAEDAISDATWFMRKYSSLDEYDQSMLRLAFAQNRELAPFAHATYSWPALSRIASRWRQWAESCVCASLNRPRRACFVHATLLWAAFFMEAMEVQWVSLTDWYDVIREGSQVEPTKLGRRSLPVLPPKLDSLR